MPKTRKPKEKKEKEIRKIKEIKSQVKNIKEIKKEELTSKLKQNFQENTGQSQIENTTFEEFKPEKLESAEIVIDQPLTRRQQRASQDREAENNERGTNYESVRELSYTSPTQKQNIRQGIYATGRQQKESQEYETHGEQTFRLAEEVKPGVLSRETTNRRINQGLALRERDESEGDIRRSYEDPERQYREKERKRRA